MHRFKALLFTLVLFQQLAAVPLAAQDGSVSVHCAEEAINLKLYKRILEQKLKSQIDSSVYTNPRVNVKFRLLKPDKSSVSKSFSEVLDGLSVSQSALSANLSGTLAFTNTCEYSYIARVRVRATEIETGAKLYSSTDSLITVESKGESKGKSIVVPVPTATAIATATPLPDNDEDEDDEEEEEDEE